MDYKVLIVDDEPLARRGIKARLKSFPDFTVVEDCEDGVAAISAIKGTGLTWFFLTCKCRV
jgi:Response regulator containing a CheY-like receiver domain and an HTH DNA-binding domain